MFAKYAAIAVLSFIAFFLLSLESMLAPYAPSEVAIILMRYVLFLVMVLSYFYFVFFYRKAGWKLTRWQTVSGSKAGIARVGLLASTIVGALVLFGAVTFCMERWLAFPTKWLANIEVSTEAECVSSEQWGKAQRRRVMIAARSSDLDQILRFSWAQDEAPRCPGRVLITGDKWIFGTYVKSVQVIN